jgi:N-acetylglucosamine-6-phosphate deacetylase
MYATFTKSTGGCQDLAVPAALLLRPAAVLGPQGLQPGAAVLVEDGRVSRVGTDLAAPPGVEYVHLPGALLAPGFVDLHVHELAGCGAIDARRPDIAGLAAALAARGTTSFLATTVAAPVGDLLDVVAHVAELKQAPGSARCLGVHLEGPWLSPARAGAQPPAGIAPPSADDLGRLLHAGPVRLVTLAPELPGADRLIELALARGVVVALGHSDADYATAAAAVRAGARHVTHCFNAMRPLHHREPGLAGAALDLPGVSVELIADGAHLHPATARLIHRAVGAERACLVSDAVDRPRADGAPLAGAAVTQSVGVQNLVDWGVPLADAAVMASRAPAAVLGHPVDIVEGAAADLVALDPSGALLGTWIAGVRA